MNLSTESIIRSSKSSITNFISQSGHKFVKKHWNYFSFLIISIALPIIWFLSFQQFLIIYLSFYVSMYLCMYLLIYVCTNLFIYHTLFLSPFSYFSNLYIFSPVSRSFPLRSMFLFLSLFLPFLTLSFPSFPSSLSSSLCLYLFPFLSLAMDWIARPMS